MVQSAHKKASLLCHPDKDPGDKDNATKAQQIINQAREILSNGAKCIWYLDFGLPRDEFTHKCDEIEPVMEFIKMKLQPKTTNHRRDTPPPSPPSPPRQQTPPSPPRQQTPPRSTSASGSANKTNSSFDPTYDSDEPSSFWSSPKAKSSSKSSEKKRGRRKSIFKPTGYQLQGGKVTTNKQRSQGPVYLMEWAAKPGYSTWLSEEDLVRYFPKEAKEYIERLKKEKSKRLSAIVRKAGPITEFL